MHYVARMPSGSPLVKPVRPLYERYFHEEIAPKFRPLSHHQYLSDLIGITTTAARFSYVLNGEAVDWCIEWGPGLLVIDVTQDSMQWAARRSPNPQFGGRSATAVEIERYEEWEETWEKEHFPVPPPQYGLIFDAWDDIVEQSFSSWQLASELQSQAIHRIFNHLDKLAEGLPKDASSSSYGERLEEWRRSDFWNMRWEDFD